VPPPRPAFDPVRLAAFRPAPVRQTYDWRDAALYALGAGAGLGGVEGPPADRAFLDERVRAVLPSFATVLGYESFWVEDPATGIDPARVLHGEQELLLHAPLPVAGTVERAIRIVGVCDRGAARGAFVRTHDSLVDLSDGTLLAEMMSTVVCRGEGGLGGTVESLPAPHPLPDRAPDAHHETPGFAQQAWIYRLSGDLNPLHVDPDIARAAGFDRPVLHGLATFGSACRVLVMNVLNGDVGAFRSLRARFAGPLYVGEGTVLSLWHEGPGRAGFRVHAAGRGACVLDHGIMAYDPHDHEPGARP
jgi:acyl dehydratase